MIRCKHCETENALNRRLCMSCGKQLDYNDPSLLVSDAEKEFKVAKSKVSYEKDNWAKKIFSGLIFSLICITFFLTFYTGHVKQKPLKMSASKSLNKKIIALESHNNSYIALSADEINVYIERAVSPLLQQIKASNSSWFTFKKCFINLNDSMIQIFLIYKLWRKPVLFTFSGTLSINDDQFILRINRTYTGKILFPVFLVKKFIKSFFQTLSDAKVFSPPENTGSLRIKNNTLILFSGQKPVETGFNTNSDIKARDLKLPDDILLIQAGDDFFRREHYQVSLKYYNLALLKYPNSPFKSHAKKRLKLCQEKLL